ncbi:Phosphatidylinositol 4-kinase pik1alpha (PI4-kinase)(PtdIns-4-kinase), partial [Spiromyces aspiralis]
ACRDYDKLYLGKVTNYLRHQKKWLGYRSNYFQNEIQFMTGLMDISRRVCLVPKASRQNSLKAELAFFNQHLKEDMCVPLWCSNHKNSMKHQRIVRIPLDDVVVLNSAERAPYLLMLEVIEADSDEEYVPPAPKKPVSPRTERPKSMEPSLPSVGHSSTLSARAVGATEPRFATVGSGSRAKRQPRNMESAVGATSATESSRQESHKNSPIRQQQQQQQGSSGNYHKANARPPTSTTHRALTSDEEGGQAAAEEKHPHDPELDTLMEAFGDINLGGEVLNPAPLARMTRDAHGWADQQPPPSSPTNYAPAHSSSAWSRDSSKRDGILISPLRP